MSYPRYRWTILGVVVAAQVVVSALYLAWASLTPFLRNEFGLTLAQVGMIVGGMPAGAAVGSMPFGRVGDRVGVRITATVGVAAVAVMGVLVTFSPSFPALLAGTFLAGLAYGAFNPAGIKILVPWFPRRELGLAVGLKQVGFPLGGALAAATLPVLTLALGSWRPPLAAVGLLAGLVAVVVFLLVRESPSPRPRAMRVPGSWRVLLGQRNVLLLSLVLLFLSGVESSWLGHLVLFAHDGLQFPVDVAARFLALSQVAAVVGRIALGLLSDRLLGGRCRELMIGCALATAVVCAGVTTLTAPPAWLFAIFVVGFGLTGASYPTLALAALAGEGGERSSGTTVGFGLTVSGISVMLGPPLFGRAVDVLGIYGPAWQGLAVLALLGALASAGLRERPVPSARRLETESELG